MSKADIQEMIFDLRAKQASVKDTERQAIQEEIRKLQKQMDSIKE